MDGAWLFALTASTMIWANAWAFLPLVWQIHVELASKMVAEMKVAMGCGKASKVQGVGKFIGCSGVGGLDGEGGLGVWFAGVEGALDGIVFGLALGQGDGLFGSARVLNDVPAFGTTLATDKDFAGASGDLDGDGWRGHGG